MSKLTYIVNEEQIAKKVVVSDVNDGEYHFIQTKGNKQYNSYRKVDMGGHVWYVQVRLSPTTYQKWILSGSVDRLMDM